VAGRGEPAGSGTQLALPLEAPEPPPLPELGAWERMVADYGSTGMTLHEHPMALMRSGLDGELDSSELEEAADGTGLRTAGLVVARQRPATANGVVFMLLEDEWGTINLVLPPPVYERHRLAARTAAFVTVRGRLERREGTMNVVVSDLAALERPDLPRAEVTEIEPPPGRETGRTERTLADLRAVLPAAHSFGRRGR
jgi:error-prone DNA polymerase